VLVLDGLFLYLALLCPVNCSLCRPLNYIPVPVLDGLFLYLAVTAVSSKLLPVQAAEQHPCAGAGRAVLVPGCDGCVQ
jgi:hypothetical protein